LKKKNRVIVLNKADLASGDHQSQILDYFKSLKQRAIFLTGNKENRGIAKLIPFALEKVQLKRESNILVMGMPNVGKSSIINSLRIHFKFGKKLLLESN